MFDSSKQKEVEEANTRLTGLCRKSTPKEREKEEKRGMQQFRLTKIMKLGQIFYFISS